MRKNNHDKYAHNFLFPNTKISEKTLIYDLSEGDFVRSGAMSDSYVSQPPLSLKECCLLLDVMPFPRI